MFLDNEGKVITSSNGNPASFRVDAAKGSDYSARFDTGASLWSSGGVFNITNATFIGEPGSQIQLSISSSYIEEGLELVQPDYYLRVNISFRECLPGEEFTSDGQCLECPPGTYLIDAPTSPTSCVICP